MKLKLLLLCLAANAVHAQVQVDPNGIKKVDRSKVVVMQPSPAPAAAPAAKASAPVSTSPDANLSEQERAMLSAYPDYYLESVKVLIHTGNDSKELPSTVTVNLVRPEGNSFVELYNGNPNNTNKVEFKPNTVTELVLANNYLKPTATPLQAEYRSGNAGGYRWYEVQLKTIEKNGLRLQLGYRPNFFTDAWKVEKVTMVLQFKDILGRPHPMLGNKEVTFYKSKLLTQGEGKLILETDGFLMPKM
jgi:hypothetical protein